MGKRKYPIELRDEVINAYLNTKDGYKKLAKKYNLKRDTVRDWVLAYKKKKQKEEQNPTQ